MRTRTAITASEAAIATTIVAAIVVAALAVLRIDTWGEKKSDPTADEIDPALIHYEQTDEIPVEMRQVRALAVGPDDRIYVAGDKAIHVFDPDGKKRSEIALGDEPKCLAVGDAKHVFPGRVYVGMLDHVEVFDAEHRAAGTWKTPGEKALFTSIAVGERDVFVGDAGSRIVWHYDTSGEIKGRIGRHDDARDVPGFLIASPILDLAVAQDGRLRVVNPLALRIETYTFTGDLKSHWGEPSSNVEGFNGCCNPIHFAILSDGRFVTAEKGKVRVKVYSAGGEFECVVAGPKQVPVAAADVAADGRDRVLILDPRAGSVRIFQRKK